MVFKGSPGGLSRVCPWLRAQLFVPALHATGIEVGKCLEEALGEDFEQPDKNGLAISVVFWSLSLILLHSDDHARKATFLGLESHFLPSEGKLIPCSNTRLMGKRLKSYRSLDYAATIGMVA
jgi:hypothetical protein